MCVLDNETCERWKSRNNESQQSKREKAKTFSLEDLCSDTPSQYRRLASKKKPQK